MHQAARELEMHQHGQGLEHREPLRSVRGGGWKVGWLVKSLGSLTQEKGCNPSRVSAGMRLSLLPLLFALILKALGRGAP